MQMVSMFACRHPQSGVTRSERLTFTASGRSQLLNNKTCPRVGTRSARRVHLECSSGVLRAIKTDT
eukprot:587633-Prorocentrum_minimum.AAC.3